MKDHAIIAAGHRVVGTISAGEDLVILGRVEGRIQSEATVVVESGAIIEGDITASHVIVRGVVVGDLQGVEGVEVGPAAQVAGDIRTRRLTLRAGGRVAGTVATGVEVAGFGTGHLRASQGGALRAPATASASFQPGPGAASWPSGFAPGAPASRPATTPSAWPSDEAVEQAVRSEPVREGL
jgi:cytoskeletal protein CcmA (bactofilin family)